MRPLLLAIALLNMATGVTIFFAPQFFYDTIPGVSMMGPFNLHFIRDAGLAYFGSGLLLALAWRRGEYAFGFGGALWPCLHALFHLQIWFARGAQVDLVALTNLAGIQVPAWAALWVLWRLSRGADARAVTA